MTVRRATAGADDWNDWWGEPVDVDSGVPHVARMNDYLLGGDAHFAADRALVDHAAEALPGGLACAQANVRAARAFLARAVRHLAGGPGIRQVLHVGTGIPDAAPDTGITSRGPGGESDQSGQSAQAEPAPPDWREVHVDHDPVVLAHAHLLGRGRPRGTVAYVDGDVRQPETVLGQAGATLDLDRPVAVVLAGALQHVLDDEHPREIVGRLLAGIAAGSYLVISHLASDVEPAATEELTRRHNAAAPADLLVARSLTEVRRFFDGLHLVPPDVVPVDRWPQGIPAGGRFRVAIYGGVARKP